MSIATFIAEAATSIKGILISFLLGVMVSGVVVWKYQSYKYEATLLEISNKSLQAQQKAQQEVLEKERVNQDAISDLNKRNAENTKKLSNALSDLRKYRSVNGGLLVKPGSSAAGMPASSTSSNSASDGKAGIEIPRDFSNFLTESLSKADQCEVDMNTAKEYGKLIEKFRKDNTK